MNSDSAALGLLSARSAAARAAVRRRLATEPLAAAAIGLLLFLSAGVALGTFHPLGAALLFVLSVAWEAVAFGLAASLTTAALSALTAWTLLKSGVAAAPASMALSCLLAAAPIALVNALAETLERRTIALSEARRAATARETLLAEAQHRFGNNLTVICAALNLQARKSADSATKRALQDANERVMLIADVNRLLAGSHLDAMRLDADFVNDLVGKCITATGAEGRVRFSVAVEPIELRADQVLPIALVLGECVNNALEHGFPGETAGEIAVRIETAIGGADGAKRLIVADDGMGLPANFDPEKATTVGLTLVRAFARQIGGVFTVESDKGTRSILTF